MSTVSGTSSSSTTAASSAAAAQAAAAQAQADLQQVGQSLISASTGNTTIDPSTLVSDLVTAKVAGQQAALETQAATDETQISAIGQLSASLSQLQVDLGPLSNGQLTSTYTASASGSGVTATASTGAAPATYSLYVGQVAQAQSLTSGAISSTDATSMGTGTMTLSLGTQSMTLNVTSANDSLSDIVSAINSSSSNPGISASIVTGSDGSHLVLTSSLTGALNTIGVSVSSGATGALAKLGVQSVPGGSGTSATYTSQAVAAGDADGTSGAATGTLTIGVGSSSMTITPTSASETLADLVQQINAASGQSGNPTVTASVATDGNGNQYLQVTSPGATASNPVTLSASSGATGLIADVATQLPSSTAAPSSSSNMTDYGASNIVTASGSIGWTQTTAAQDAYFTINGTPATSSLNNVNSALTGVKMSLASTAAGTTQTLTIAPDTTTMSTEIGQFVSDYNSLVSTIGTLTQFNSSTPSASGPLLGDSMIQQIQSTFGTIVGSAVKGSGVTSTLANLGVTLNSDGTLTLDTSTLDQVLQNDPAQVSAVFNSTNGIGQQLNAQINSFTDSGGIISVRNNQLSTDLTSITTQSDSLTTYSQQLTSMYTDQFTQLNSVMATSYSESQYLTDLFGGSQGGGALNKSS